MLNEKDLKAIADLFERKFDEKIKPALTEFFETLILPYFEHNEKDHKEIKQQLDKHGSMLKEHGELLEKHDVELDKIYRKLEKNDDNHEEMFRRLDKNDKDHGRIFTKFEELGRQAHEHKERIKKLEISSGLTN